VLTSNLSLLRYHSPPFLPSHKFPLIHFILFCIHTHYNPLFIIRLLLFTSLITLFTTSLSLLYLVYTPYLLVDGTVCSSSVCVLCYFVGRKEVKGSLIREMSRGVKCHKRAKYRKSFGPCRARCRSWKKGNFRAGGTNRFKYTR
jgi:hypothetical protein